jgi:hypothetical protein
MNAESSAFLTCLTLIRRCDHGTIAPASMKDEFRMVMIESRYSTAIIEYFLSSQRGLQVGITFVVASLT